MNFVVGRAVCTSVFVSLSVGEITEERIAQEVLKFKILLTSSGGRGCLWGWKWKPFSSNSGEWVHGQGPIPRTWNSWAEENAEAAWSSLSSRFLILASRWSIGGNHPPPPRTCICALCVSFLFLFGDLMGKGFWALCFVNSHCVPVKSFFFHCVVSYVFIKARHIFFTVKLLNGCFQVGQLVKF